MHLHAFILALLLGPATALASTPEAAARLDATVNLACRDASGLKDPVVVALAVRFSDAMPIEARMVRGTAAGSAEPGKDAMLCLYDRRTGVVETQAVLLAGALLR